jgi:cytidylate kinase
LKSALFVFSLCLQNNFVINIAIDGYSSCGKSTIAKALAKALHYHYIDTGAMYRAIALFAVEQRLVNMDNTINQEALNQSLEHIQIDFEFNSNSGKSEVYLNGRPVEALIRNIKIAEIASKISQLRAVRNKLQYVQKILGTKKGVVMDGRDIGTVVMPQAELKIFMTADPLVRAQRRLIELKSQGKESTIEEVLDNQTKRDYQDTHRAEDPLVMASEALLLDNSKLTPDEQLSIVLQWVKEKSLQHIYPSNS